MTTVLMASPYSRLRRTHGIAAVIGLPLSWRAFTHGVAMLMTSLDPQFLDDDAVGARGHHGHRFGAGNPAILHMLRIAQGHRHALRQPQGECMLEIARDARRIHLAEGRQYL